MKKYKSNSYTSVDMPVLDGHPSYHRPRRNYWGNLKEEDTYKEDEDTISSYDYSNYDCEDDHSSYYENDSYT